MALSLSKRMIALPSSGEFPSHPHNCIPERSNEGVTLFELTSKSSKGTAHLTAADALLVQETTDQYAIFISILSSQRNASIVAHFGACSSRSLPVGSKQKRI